MFCRLPKSLPEDPIFPRNLEKLGLFINERGLLRTIDNPDEPYKYRITNNERYNDLYKEAVWSCVRSEILQRVQFERLLEIVYLPQIMRVKPDGEYPHLPILTSSPKVLQNCKRVILLIQDSRDQWLSWSYKDIEVDNGLNNGSVISFARLAKQNPDVGLIVLNTTQLLYSYNLGVAMSRESWENRHRESLVHGSVKITEANLINGNETPENHIRFVLDNIVGDSAIVNAKATADVIALNAATETVLEFFDQTWDIYHSRISTIALVNLDIFPTSIKGHDFINFLEKRARAWHRSEHEPKGTIVSHPGNETLMEFSPAELDGGWTTAEEAAKTYKELNRILCPVISAGQMIIATEAFGKVFGDVLKWLDDVAANEDYENEKYEHLRNGT